MLSLRKKELVNAEDSTTSSKLTSSSLNHSRSPSMARDFFDASSEEQNVVLVDPSVLRKVDRLIESCEHCNLEGAEILFDDILNRVTGSDPSVTDYILETPAKCPSCRRPISEKTLIEPA